MSLAPLVRVWYLYRPIEFKPDIQIIFHKLHSLFPFNFIKKIIKNDKSPGFDEIDAVPVKRVIHIMCSIVCNIQFIINFGYCTR